MSAGGLRVLSANLWCGGADPEVLAARIEELGVDVAAVQELAPGQAEALAAVLPHGHLEPRSDYHGMGIALRRPAEVKRWSLPYRDARCAELDPLVWPGLAGPLRVVNVHLLAPHGHLLRSPRIRRGQVRGVLAQLAGAPGRSLLVGDLNATPVWPAYRRVAAALEDAAVSHARRAGRRPARTWSPWGLGPALLRLDHAFSEGVAVNSVRTVRLDGSDHRALLVELAAEPPEAEARPAGSG